MLKRFLAVGICLTVASTAFAGATVDLVTVDTYGGAPIMAPNPDGTWAGGETFVVEVMMNSDTDFFVRGMQVDWRGSSPELTLGEDIDAVNQPIDGVANFAFDYSPITVYIPGPGLFPQGTYPAAGNPGMSTTGDYQDFSNLFQGDPIRDWPASTTYTGPADDGTGPATRQLPVAAGTPFRVGGILVTLPMEMGAYTLDLLKPMNLDNAVDYTNENFGMVMDFGFGIEPGDDITKWGSAVDSPNVHDAIVYSGARNGTGGPLTFTVIPEPATLVLLGLGGLAAARRRRS